MTKKKKIGNVGIRLKPNEPNLLENYNHFRKRTRKKKRRRKPKRTRIKKIEIHEKIDPLLKILNDDKRKSYKSDIIIEEKDEPEPSVKDESVKDESVKDESVKDESVKDESVKEPQEIKKVRVDKKAQHLSETDPNVKSLTITASTEPEHKKKGQNIKLN